MNNVTHAVQVNPAVCIGIVQQNIYKNQLRVFFLGVVTVVIDIGVFSLTNLPYGTSPCKEETFAERVVTVKLCKRHCVLIRLSERAI